MAPSSRTRTVAPGDVVPQDTFSVRLAIVRAVMGWNYSEAAAATGVNGEAWRTWEKRTRRCADPVGIARQISAATGLSVQWLALGGPLEPEEWGGPEGEPGPQRLRGRGASTRQNLASLLHAAAMPGGRTPSALDDQARRAA